MIPLRLAITCTALALIGTSVSAARAASPDGAWNLPQLMRQMATVRSASGSFTERKTFRMLTIPLTTTGELVYKAPYMMEKITLTPVPERFLLDHDRVTVSGGADNQTHRFSLSDDPRIGGLVEGIRATLAGDLASLQRIYRTSLAGTESRWELTLQPRQQAVAQIVRWMRIDGSGDRIGMITTTDANGDSSVMNIAESVNAAP